MLGGKTFTLPYGDQERYCKTRGGGIWITCRLFLFLDDHPYADEFLSSTLGSRLDLCSVNLW